MNRTCTTLMTTSTSISAINQIYVKRIQSFEIILSLASLPFRFIVDPCEYPSKLKLFNGVFFQSNIRLYKLDILFTL